MIDLKIAYDDKSESLVKELEKVIAKYPMIELETFHENLFKEKRKAYKFKGGYSARKTPFAVLSDIERNIIKAFYSESGDCTSENIIRALNEIIPYKNLD